MSSGFEINYYDGKCYLKNLWVFPALGSTGPLSLQLKNGPIFCFSKCQECFFWFFKMPKMFFLFLKIQECYFCFSKCQKSSFCFSKCKNVIFVYQNAKMVHFGSKDAKNVIFIFQNARMFFLFLKMPKMFSKTNIDIHYNIDISDQTTYTLQ